MEATPKTKESSFGLSYPMLTMTNYIAWALKMKVFMQAHGVWEAIEPKDPKTAVEDKIDKRALAVIYQGVPKDVLLSLAEKKSSKDAWTAVKNIFLGPDKVKVARAQTLKSEFEALTMREDEQFDDFYLKLNRLVTNIRVLGEKVEEAYVVKKLLRAVVGSLKAHEERLRGTTEKGQGQLLLTEKKWRKKESSDGQLLLTRDEWQKRANQEGTRGGGNTRGIRDKSRVRCFNCQGHGHFAAECRRPRKERETPKEANLSNIQEDELALLIAEVGQTDNEVMLLKEDALVPKLCTNVEG
ncbi:hypothetical protein AgCh_002654 [Apium graveolens]